MQLYPAIKIYLKAPYEIQENSINHKVWKSVNTRHWDC